ncbi:E3 ubiquitin-protein ligase RNF6 [Symbiodinium microadriaticum]|uniref:E3 ubiquitin-protein ligase RNF6 n=1 Tax=Symbiodinium microadriaticum TaxID=2951 RepID=A0A1Q9DMH5_SYMMI|nr:E3 ubiquitin-protein ligase RNF6 [Symbiodinium microadriaticum]
MGAAVSEGCVWQAVVEAASGHEVLPHALRTKQEAAKAAAAHWAATSAESDVVRQRELYAAAKEAYGSDHVKTLTAAARLAAELQAVGDMKEAEALLRQSAQGLEVCHNLAVLLDDQDNLLEAEGFYRKALDASEVRLGESHPETLEKQGVRACLEAMQDVHGLLLLVGVVAVASLIPSLLVWFWTRYLMKEDEVPPAFRDVGIDEIRLEGICPRRLEQLVPSAQAFHLKRDPESQSARWICTLCMGDMLVGQHVRRLPCEHIFHRSCVDIWLAKNEVCPTCRSAVVPAEGHPESGQGGIMPSRTLTLTASTLSGGNPSRTMSLTGSQVSGFSPDIAALARSSKLRSNNGSGFSAL